MATGDDLAALSARIERLERDALKRARDQVVDNMLIVVLLTWTFERNPDMNYDALANELMHSVDDLPLADVPPERAPAVRALLSTSLDQTLALVREKVQEAKQRRRPAP